MKKLMSLQVEESDKERWELAAGRSGMKLSGWMREVLNAECVSTEPLVAGSLAEVPADMMMVAGQPETKMSSVSELEEVPEVVPPEPKEEKPKKAKAVKKDDRCSRCQRHYKGTLNRNPHCEECGVPEVSPWGENS